MMFNLVYFMPFLAVATNICTLLGTADLHYFSSNYSSFPSFIANILWMHC